MKKSALKLFQLEVTREEIEEMYDRYDSGMADHTTSNAVSLALRKKMRSEFIPKIVSASGHDGCRLQVGGESIALSVEVCIWLDRAGKGFAVSPTAFPIVLPQEILQLEVSEEAEVAEDEAESVIAA